MEETEVLEVVKKEAVKKEENSLVIYNDDINTFDHVIDSLVKVCKHEMVQAEQCTWIIHYNGKCAVKNGNFKILKPMKDALNERGINSKIH
ncbi:ATP-dependent Clp protease adaptor ClpS [Putridiphycobacter roseus]|uniref:ATP-dependent Clp protease adaptor ClpS n=1 Tax=Putridiphycobacter roseus TaxID=2219161 RepID=A0A2W1NF73_9FLAO|nr:ATP-dependent Clp protease adaptor ClpS [Putridiphycobacter roseus]PZE17753.1 ATP-dependent Clp protease adaptor ClpS [Putridiphycobacter roseus]